MAVAKLAVSTAPARRVCVGCDMLTEPARPGAPLCKLCFADPTEARARIGRRLEASTCISAAAAARYAAALAALTDEERERWHRLGRARVVVADGAADEVTRKRVHVTLDALKNQSPKMTPALIAIYAAEEAQFWAGEEYAAHARRAAEQTDVLDTWLTQQEHTP